MINPICDCCKKELKDFGGLAFSPPDSGGCSKNNKSIRRDVKKYHFCNKCWLKIEKLIYGKKEK
jgi:hypothetical protein